MSEKAGRNRSGLARSEGCSELVPLPEFAAACRTMKPLVEFTTMRLGVEF